ncbi:MAG: hypothetical protein SFY56_03275 [Bacteroidota bacterium]|nr:hypothetical protein [Bacteroidota bacterium]
MQCRKPTSANWDVDMVFPVVTSQLNIKNFLGDTIFKSDNTGLLNLSLTRTITAIKLDSLIKLPDTTISKAFLAFFPVSLTPGQSFTALPAAELTFSLGNSVALKKVEIKSGSLNVKFSNSTSQALDLVYSISSAVKNNQPFEISETIPPGNNSLIKNYSLDGYSLNMQGLSGNLYNTIIQTYTVALSANAQATTIPSGQGALIEVKYSDITPQYAEGYFGQQTVPIALDTTVLDIVNNFDAKNFMLNSATFNFNILNQFGAEFSGSLFNIKAINSSSTVPLTTAALSNININRASKMGTTIFQTVKSVSLTTTNSNIAPFLSLLPNKLTYQGSIVVNPLGNLSGFNDFAFYNTGLNVTADVNIPMRFNASSFKLSSTTAVDFTNIKQLEKVNFGDFVLSASNGYPFNAQLQAYMLDENQQIIDSLFIPSANTFMKGITDAQNIVTFPTRTSIKAPFDRTKIQNLKKTKSLKIITYFIMPPNPPDIKLYENYTFDVNIIAELNYNVKAG